jgi:hypothetical protein
MSPQIHLSNFIDTILLAYILNTDSELPKVKQTIIDEYKRLNDRCDIIIDKINKRKSIRPESV